MPSPTAVGQVLTASSFRFLGEALGWGCKSITTYVMSYFYEKNAFKHIC